MQCCLSFFMLFFFIYCGGIFPITHAYMLTNKKKVMTLYVPQINKFYNVLGVSSHVVVYHEQCCCYYYCLHRRRHHAFLPTKNENMCGPLITINILRYTYTHTHERMISVNALHAFFWVFKHCIASFTYQRPNFLLFFFRKKK